MFAHRICLWLTVVLSWGAAACSGAASEPLRVLILSGANNHDWQSTTPALHQLIVECPRFRVVDVLEDPRLVTAERLQECDVIASNWSAYPAMTGHQWGAEAERALVEWIKAGHGLVVFHAASATSQDWPEFQQVVHLTWGLGKTGHGAYHTLKVTVRDGNHPITRGMPDFWTTDELWHNLVNLSGQATHALCDALSEPDFGGTGKFEPVVVPTALGSGRGLNIVLGHDVNAMCNVGWRTLMLRGLEWAATGDVTLPLPTNWPTTAAAATVVRPVATDEKLTAWYADALTRTTDADTRRSLVRQLAGAVSVSSLELAVQLLQQDGSVREEAASTAACIGSSLTGSERQRVKSAMQKVISLSHNVDTIKQADMALRTAARPVNLALNVSVSSPDGLEPDGASGSDAAAVDGNRGTYWDETDNQPAYRFRMQFPHPTNVNTVVIVGHAYLSHSPKDFEVLCDDQVVATITSAAYDQKTNETHVRFPRRNCSSLELKITGYYAGSPGLREVEVYDVDTGLASAAYTPLPADERKLSWQSGDGQLALLNYSRIVWAFHFGRDAAKPYFDPLGLVDGVSLVWKSPPDHPWHHGLWFSWKEINGVNYWEEDAATGRAAGVTEVVSSKVTAGDDFTARIELQLLYHEPERPAVLSEKRNIRISVPDQQGNYTIDCRSTFQSGNQDLLLKGGTAGGGYAGLSVRMAGDSQNWQLLDGEGRHDVPGADALAKNLHGQHARWMDLSVVHTASGQAAGITIFEHPSSLRHPSQWHCVLEDKIPFGYFSPSPLWSEPYAVKAGDSFQLAYRVLVHSQRLPLQQLEQTWKDYAATKE